MSARIDLKALNNAYNTARALVEGAAAKGFTTYTGAPLRPLQHDCAEGEEIADGVHSRGRRVSVGDDVVWSEHAVNGFYAAQGGRLRRSKSAMKTGVDLSKFDSLAAFREELVRGDAEKLAASLTPASIDEAPSLFLVSELILSLPGIVQVERATPSARDVLPMRFLNAPGAEFYRFHVIDDYGDAQWTSNFDGTPPVVGNTREVVTRPLEYLWIMARWGIKELWQWQMARDNGSPLPDFARLRPMLGRESLLRHENLWLYFGGPTGSKMLGLLSSGNAIPVMGPLANWVNLTPAANVAAVTDAIAAITLDGVERPDTILMGTAQYTYLASTQWPNTDKMILGVLMEALRPMGIKEILAVPEMTYRAALKTKFLAKKYDDATATRYAGGLGGKDVMVVLSRRLDKVAGICNQDVRSLAPDVTSTETTVTQVLGSGGCEVRYPQAHRIVQFNAPA